MTSKWETVKLGDIATKRTDFTPVVASDKYEVVGVQRSGWGLARRDPVRGDSMKFSKLMRLHKDDLVYRVITAFEAPSSVVDSSFEGSYVTPQTFPVFKLDTVQILPDFMQLLTTYPVFHADMAERCTGSVLRRKTLAVSSFLEIPIALPPLVEQHRIVDLIGALDDAIEAANEKLAALVLVAGNQRDAMYDSPIKLIELESICSSDGSLVSPLAPEYANMPHIGIDRIESGTGDLLSAQSAAEDGVTSGKFKFDSSHVIYSKIRPELQKVALPEFDGICSADAYPLLPIEGVPRIYLQQLLLSSGFTRKVVSKSGRTKMPKINKKELLSILVPQHGTQEMLNFSELATAIAVARHKAATQLDSLRALRTELLTSLLSGAHEIPESYDEVMNAV